LPAQPFGIALKHVCGDAPQMQMLLKMQFSAQQQQYAAYKDAELQIVLSDDEPVGCWYVQRKPDEFLIIDVAILPEHQSGIGRALVRGFLEEAATRNIAVRAHVLKANRAWFLWQRMGFRIVGDAGMHHEILWSPEIGRESQV
jgi:ribosomal protein S18 acetylase RimI-like enzyme